MIKQLAFLTLFNLLTINIFAQKTLPDLTVKTLEGKTVNVKDLAKSGKITILNFWATWCGPCQKELNNISKRYDKWQKDYNVELVAVTIDNIQGLPKVKPLVAQKGWKYNVVSDANSELLQRLGGQNVPFTAIIDQKGKIVAVHTSYKDGDEVEMEKKLAALAAK
jgi:cytochrome c biogenesis protein CcmG, thiol:disulfide interchange protein DsbE